MLYIKHGDLHDVSVRTCRILAFTKLLTLSLITPEDNTFNVLCLLGKIDKDLNSQNTLK
jgi:hypothetical protein